MSDEWKTYFGGRIIKDVPPGIKIIKGLETMVDFVVDCPICGFLMKDINDTISYDKYKCCQSCTFQWAQGNRHAWMDGWRPTKEQVGEHVNFLMNQPTYRIK